MQNKKEYIHKNLPLDLILMTLTLFFIQFITVKDFLPLKFYINSDCFPSPVNAHFILFHNAIQVF
jgi:hypothetical protein